MREYLSEKEAAEFACLSLSKFRERIKRYGVMPGRSLGTLPP